MGSTMGLEEAQHAVWQDDFDPEAAFADGVLVSRLLSRGRASARSPRTGSWTPTSLGWLWVAGVWARVGPAARKARDKHGVPELLENVEALAAKHGS